MRSTIEAARALDRDALDIKNWDTLCQAVERYEAEVGSLHGIKVIRHAPLYFEPSPDEPFEPFINISLSGGEDFNLQSLCYRYGANMIGGPPRALPQGPTRRLHDKVSTDGLAELSRATWEFKIGEGPIKAREAMASGELLATLSMLISTGTHIAFRNALRRNGLPCPAHFILANDGESPEFGSPIVTKEEYGPVTGGRYFALGREPQYAAPKIWSEEETSRMANPRQLMMANLLNHAGALEYDELSNKRDAAFIARGVRLRFVQDHVEETYDEREAKRKGANPFGIDLGIKPKQAEAAANFVLRDVLRTSPNRMKDPALREAVKLFGDIFRK
ncbi:hypothetical protein [Erythrobacter sp. F6033]|uniref:hypothetical protein n=1 Tax=Erythrobacter sp. F6033 TaxID=2926401 RepID=UPI001FF557B6|nr:hypothetical protein [Erythrobacter sp. F6033]MCK0128666.1 hypothetical protein [Erythrobacter sp. F6033]